MRLSYSQIDWFLRCPYIFKYQYIDKHRLPSGKAAVFGGLMHKVLEFIHKDSLLTPTPTQAMQFFEQKWEKNNLEKYFKTKIDAEKHYEEGLRIIKDYYESNDFSKIKILALEKRFEIPLIDKNGESHILSGIIDRIDKMPDETLEVIDYKTSVSMKTEREIKSDLQLSIYYLGLNSLWPDMVKKHQGKVKAGLYFLRHGEKISTEKTQEELNETKNKLLGYIKNIKRAITENKFPAKPSSLCKYEPYNDICPYFKNINQKEKLKIKNQEVDDVIREFEDLKINKKQIENKIKELQDKINNYLDEEKLEGIYNKEKTKGIIRSLIENYEYDQEKLKNILTSLQRWDDVLNLSQVKLNKVLIELPFEIKSEIEKLKILKRETKSLRLKIL